MNLMFLYPWLLFGALAVAAPLWLHLRRKQPTNVLPFSALRFLEDQPLPQAGRIRLRDVLLFLLRALAVLLLAGAFAWPYLRSDPPPLVKESRVYILDNTLSHQARDGFERDRQRILDDLALTGPHTQMAVLELTTQPNVIATFTDSPDEARRKVAALIPSYERGSYLTAFRLANQLLQNSFGEVRRIVFCGDNQENQWTEKVNVPPFLDGVEIEMPESPVEPAPNLSVAEPRLNRVFLGDKSLVSFSVTLRHAGDIPNARVTLRANDQTIFNRSLPLQDQPEAILLQSQWEADPGSWLQGSVAVEGSQDALSGDNEVFFSLPPVREGQIALLAQSPYLRMALSPEVMRGHWKTHLIDPANLSQDLSAQEDAEVLVMESAYLHSAQARALVWSYLKNGKGVFLLVNRLSPVITAMLRDLGFEVDARSPAVNPPDQRLEYFLSNHPIFHPFISPDYGNLLEIKVTRYHRLKADQGLPLLYSSSGDGLFFQGAKHPGTLYVAAFGFESEQTSWPTHVTFIPFLDLCLQASRPASEEPSSFEPGMISTLSLTGTNPAQELVLRQGQREMDRIPVIDGQARLTLPRWPGLYTVSLAGETEPVRIFSINPSAKESHLTYLQSPSALDLWRFQNGETVPQKNPQPSLESMALSAILQQEIWWWLIVAAGASLLLESLWTMKRSTLT